MPIERLRASRSFLHEFVEAVPGAVYAKDRAGRLLLGNAGFAEAVGWQSGGFVGKTDLELLADKDLARRIMENDQRILAGRERCQLEEELRTGDGRTTYWLSTKSPFTDEDGNIAGLVGVSIDITERKRLEERERLLAREIEHRNKNLLGVVQSVVRLTRAETIKEYREAVSGRLEALGRAQDVLTREHRQPVQLGDLLQEGLAAYGGSRGDHVRLAGPAICVRADATQPLAMTFHELATNAAKYGAFADVSGTLDVTWDLASPNGTSLAIEWREKGGPPIETPVRQGFGTRLVRSMVERQLHGTLTSSWEPDGVRYLISLPLQRLAPS